jgi:hypothetical protein
MNACQLPSSELMSKTSHFSKITIPACSAHEAQKALPGVFIGSVSLFLEVYYQCLLACLSYVVVNKAVDAKLIKKTNPVVTNSSMRLFNQAINTFSKNVKV